MDPQLASKLVIFLMGAGLSLFGFLAVQLWGINAKLAVLINSNHKNEKEISILQKYAHSHEKRIYSLELGKRQ